MKKKAEVTWENVWTSEGQAFKGDMVSLPADEVASLASIGAVMPEKKAKPKASKAK